MNNNYEGVQKVLELHNKFVQEDISRWLEVEVFTLQWWILVAFSIVPWFIWIKLYDKKRLLEIALIGALSYIFTSILDTVGFDLDFWYYPTELVPLAGFHFSFDISMVAVIYMLLYQYFIKWKPYLLALIIMAVLYAFIGEPLAHKLQLVQYVKWKYIYSFFFYIFTGVVIKSIVEKLRHLYVKETG